jgi:RasGEF domain
MSTPSSNNPNTNINQNFVRIPLQWKLPRKEVKAADTGPTQEAHNIDEIVDHNLGHPPEKQEITEMHHQVNDNTNINKQPPWMKRTHVNTNSPPEKYIGTIADKNMPSLIMPEIKENHHYSEHKEPDLPEKVGTEILSKANSKEQLKQSETKVRNFVPGNLSKLQRLPTSNQMPLIESKQKTPIEDHLNNFLKNSEMTLSDFFNSSRPEDSKKLFELINEKFDSSTIGEKQKLLELALAWIKKPENASKVSEEAAQVNGLIQKIKNYYDPGINRSFKANEQPNVLKYSVSLKDNILRVSNSEKDRLEKATKLEIAEDIKIRAQIRNRSSTSNTAFLAKQAALSGFNEDTSVRIIPLEKKVNEEVLTALPEGEKAPLLLTPYSSKSLDDFRAKIEGEIIYLKSVLDNPNLNISFKNLEVIENALLHKLELHALTDPNQVTAKELGEIRKLIQESENTGRKLVFNIPMNRLELEPEKPRTSSLSGSFSTPIRSISTSLKTTKKDPDELNFILGKLENLDPSLKKEGSELIAAVRNNAKFNVALEKNRGLKEKLDQIEANLNRKTTEEKIDAREILLKPMGNREFQRDFLLSYGGDIIHQMTKGIPGYNRNAPDSEKLFLYINTTYAKADFYQKQQLVNLAEQWLKDPFINSGEVSERKEDTEKLIGASALDKSPTMNEMSKKLENSLNEALVAEAEAVRSKIELPQGKISIQDTIKQIATNDKLTPKSKEYQQAVRNLALSITSHNAVDFNSIGSSELQKTKKTVNENGKEKEIEAWGKTIVEMTDNLNDLSDVLTNSLIDPTGDISTFRETLSKEDLKPKLDNLTPEQRKIQMDNQKKWQMQTTKVLEFYIHVQQELISQDHPAVDLQGWMTIQSVINRGPVERLTKGFIIDRSSNDVQKEFYNYQELGNAYQSYQNLREKTEGLLDSKKPVIPYLGMYQTDITQLIENKTIVENEKNEKLINSKKIELLSVPYEKINNMQKNLPVSREVNVNLKVETKYNENKAYDLSYLIEPRT